jgi:transposase
MTIPGVGAVIAAAITTFAPPTETFFKGRDFATCWAHAATTFERRQGPAGPHLEDGQRDIRQLHIIGAVAVVRWAGRKGAPRGSGLPGCRGACLTS